MDKILLVEDNKSLSKLISLKISASTDLEVDIAYSLNEAMLFSRKNNYIMALLDINLPDAPNGEIVDAILKQKIPSIVLSGNMNKEFRQSILKKSIIDYVGKGGIADLDYIVTTIKRLLKNRQHRVLVVDDSLVFRNQMQSMLKNMFFNVSAVAHGEEALGMLQEFPDTKIVLTDYEMPVMDGLELTKEIRKTHSKDELSIMAISGNDDGEVSAMFLKSGATDFIKKPFSKEEFSCRVNNTIEALENIEEITNHESRDFLTGLYNRKCFFEQVSKYFDMAKEEDEHFAIAMVDIDDFKDISIKHGNEVADKLVIHLSEILQSLTKEYDTISRFDSAEFCLILKNINSQTAVDVLENIKTRVQTHPLKLSQDKLIDFTISVGLETHQDEDLNESVNVADMRLYTAKKNGTNTMIFE